MSYETLLYQVEDGVALITINRPKVLNALNQQVIQELGQAMGLARDDDAVKVVILTGSGEKGKSHFGDDVAYYSDRI